VPFVVDKVALGQVFFEYFGLPCQFSFHQLLHIHHHHHHHHHLSSIIWGWYKRPVSGQRTEWTQFHLTPPKKKLEICICKISIIEKSVEMYVHSVVIKINN
jgi:hypothetical protein